MVNYGIVGAGYFGADLARSMNKIEDAKVVAVFDPNHGEEVAQELGVSKRVIKYHKEKLGLFEATLENGVIKISPQGVEKIKGFVRPKEYTQNFETEVLQRLEAIEERLAADDFDNRDPKEVIRSFWQYLIATPNAAEILEELVGDVVTLEPEQDFYRETARLVDLENGISELPLFGDGSDIFDSDWP